MKLNASKCKLIISGNKEEVIIASIDDSKIIESHGVTLLGAYIDRELKFDDHMNDRYRFKIFKINLNCFPPLCYNY